MQTIAVYIPSPEVIQEPQIVCLCVPAAEALHSSDLLIRGLRWAQEVVWGSFLNID